jgi:hypothetical protein
MTQLATYIPEEVNVLIGGLLPISGFVDGTFLEVRKDIIPFSSTRTPDGTVARLYNNDQTYTITLTLYSGSDSNDVLTKFWQLDEITQRGKFPLMIRDSSGSDMFFSTTTWIESPASIVKSNNFDSRTWVLRSSQAVINIGGNGDAASILGSLVNLAISAIPTIEGII